MVRSGLLDANGGSDRGGSDRTTRHCWARSPSTVAAIWDPTVSRADAGTVQMRTEHSPSAAERRPPITVALIDDEQLVRVGLAQALSTSGLELVGEAATGEDGIELVVDLRPDVVLMDLQLPG